MQSRSFFEKILYFIGYSIGRSHLVILSLMGFLLGWKIAAALFCIFSVLWLLISLFLMGTTLLIRKVAESDLPITVSVEVSEKPEKKDDSKLTTFFVNLEFLSLIFICFFAQWPVMLVVTLIRYSLYFHNMFLINSIFDLANRGKPVNLQDN